MRDRLTPGLHCRRKVRRVRYTTNAIESLNNNLRKPICTRARFPIDAAVIKLLFLELRKLDGKWRLRTAKEWQRAILHLQSLFGSRHSMAV